MRTLHFLIALGIGLTFSGCATHQAVSLPAENTHVVKNYGLYLEPLDPCRNFGSNSVNKPNESMKMQGVNVALATYR